MGLLDIIPDFLGITAQKDAAKQTKRVAGEQLRAYREASPYYTAILQAMARRAFPGGAPGLPGMGTPGIAGPLPQQPQTQPQRRQAGFGTATRFQGASTQGMGQAAGGASIQPMQRLTGGPGPVPLGGGVGQQPDYRQVLMHMAEREQAGSPQDVYEAMGMLPNRQLGIYGQDPADVLRMQAAEEDIARYTRQAQNQLAARLARQGIGNSATAAAAQGSILEEMLRQLANQRRNLAISAGQEEERRLNALLGMLNPALTMGQQGAANYQALGQQGQQQQNMLLDLLPLFFMSRGGGR